MQHSASSISLANRCHRAWWLRYREGLKPPELSWLKAKRAKARGDRLPAGAYSKALGKEVHRLAELYLTLPPKRAARVLDWNDLPGQCLQALVPHLPPAGSVPRRDVEARMSVRVNGVAFRGLIDVVLPALKHAVHLSDHKTSRDIRAYALLPDAVARGMRQPKRSLKDDLQACLYVLARANKSKPAAPGGLCRWGYTETQRSRRALPVVQYIPTAHARTVANAAAATAEQVESFKTIDDAVPNTLACSEYGGCWYRSEGHCRVPRKWGSVFIQAERDAEEQKNMKPVKFKQLNQDTAKANAAEEAKAKVAKALKSKPPVDEDEEDDSEESEDEDDAPESEPAPKPSKRLAKKAKAAKKAAPVEDDDDSDDEDDAPESEPAPKAPSAREQFNAATAAPDAILQYFTPAGTKGEAKIVATAFSELASHLSDNLPRNPERSFCLRKLLEARDCAVRAAESEG